MMRIDTVLSNFGNSSGEAPHLPHQTPLRIKKCKKRTFYCPNNNLTVQLPSTTRALSHQWAAWEAWPDHIIALSLPDAFSSLQSLSCSPVGAHEYTPAFLFFLLLDHIFHHVSTGGLGVRTAGRGLSLCDVTNLSPAAYRKLSHDGSQSSDARCCAPVPPRKRRCTMVVDYKEPTLNA